MSAFRSSEQANEVFGELFRVLVADDAFRTRVREAGLSLHLVQTKPDMELFVDADGVSATPPGRPAAIRMKMSCDTAHALWSGRLLMPVALATGRVRIRGNVAKVLELVPILAPAFDRYAEIAALHGVAA